MKATPSVLFSELAGKAGSVVASRWKGIPYVRSLVTPANPNSAAQQTQREYMRLVTGWWQDLESQLQDYCDTLVEGQALSGFNAFSSQNLKDLADTVDPRIIPTSSQVDPIDNLAAEGGTNPNDVVLTWDQGEAETGDTLYVLACEEEDDELTRNLTLVEKETSTVQAEASADIALPKYSTKYTIFVLVEHEADSTFSVARLTTHTTDAEA